MTVLNMLIYQEVYARHAEQVLRGVPVPICVGKGRKEKRKREVEVKRVNKFKRGKIKPKRVREK